MQFNLAIATAILAYVAQAAPQGAIARRGDSCTKTFSVCMAQAGFDAERNQQCNNDRAQCINKCNVESAGAELTACTGTTKEESSKPMTGVARRGDDCTKTFSVCKAQAGFDAERNAKCDNDHAQCTNTGTAVARGEDCSKTYSVCKAQAGFDAERNAKCDNDHAQCTNTGTAVARSEDCSKTYSVCKAQAGFDAERNAKCDNDHAQCTNTGSAVA
ncbi:hypothetical protein PG988_007852 [Apiospora saccharicola]